MKAKNLLISAGLMLLPTIASAALPPFWQTQKEMKAVLDNADVANLFTSGRGIKSITRSANGWVVASDKCTLEVEVVYTHSGVGPAQFDLVVPAALTCQ